MYFLKSLENIYEKVSVALIYISGFCIAATILVITLEIFLRNVFSATIIIADELSGYLLVATLFFGVTYTQKMDGLVRVDFLTRRLSSKVRTILFIPVYIFSIIYVAIVLKYSYGFVLNNYMNNIKSLSSLPIPLFIPQSAIIVGLIFLLIQLIIEFLLKIAFLVDERKADEQ